MPKVTVLVPAYNNERYMRECLDSIRDQSLEDIEVLCLNDGSTDGTLDIMREYEAADARFSVIDKSNSGYGHTMNLGFDEAKGEYVTALESDDVFPKTACQDMYEFAVEQDLDFCKADAKAFFGYGDGRTYTPAPATHIAACYEDVYDASADPGRWPGRAGPPGMYRVSFLREHGIRHNESPGASYQDTGFFTQVVFCGKRVRYLAKTCYLLRRDNPGSSELDTSKVYAICNEYDFVHEKALSLPGVNREKCLAACAYFTFRGYSWNCSRLEGPVLREFIDRFARDMRAYDDEGILDRSYFEPDELAALEKLLKDPVAYYYENWVLVRETLKATDMLVVENAQLRHELERTQGSVRYRVGTVVTAPARLLRKIVP